MTRAIVALVAACAGPAAIAGQAAALQPGVSVSPGSPAGKEYAIPLDVQRAAAVGHAAPAGVGQPLFGVGIAAAGLRGGGTSGASRKASGAGASGTGASGARARTPGGAGLRPAASALSPAAVQSLTHPRSTASEVGLLAIPVVLGGLLAGATIAIAVRRRRG